MAIRGNIHLGQHQLWLLEEASQEALGVGGQAILKNHRQNVLNNKHLSLAVLEAAKSQVKVPAAPPSGEGTRL